MLLLTQKLASQEVWGLLCCSEHTKPQDSALGPLSLRNSSLPSAVCGKLKADVGFLVDESSSMGQSNFNKVKDFLFRIVSYFPKIGPEGTQARFSYSLSQSYFPSVFSFCSALPKAESAHPGVVEQKGQGKTCVEQKRQGLKSPQCQLSHLDRFPLLGYFSEIESLGKKQIPHLKCCLG